MTLRLLSVLEAEWETIDGYAVSQGLPDLDDLPLGRLANFIWFFLIRNGDAEGIEKLRGQIWMPPKGVAVTDERSPWSPAQENKAFASLQASLGVLPPSKERA